MNSSDSFDSLFPPGSLDGVLAGPKAPSEEESALRGRKVWKVSELLEHLNDVLYLEYGRVWIEGEISGISIPPSGHNYFTLKDNSACLKSVLFKNQARLLNFSLSEGQKVLCLGRLNIYGPRGDLQVIAETLEPWGEGRLRIAFEELKKRLAAEGLFDVEKKKEPPRYPENIFVISSPTGAALRDFLRTARDRFPCAGILICPSSVQGDAAPGELVDAITLAESQAGENDVMVITRGGGSLEDLWAFNEERVVRRVFECRVPVISAIGHEVDFTLCDLAADVRAATPTAAAHVALPAKQELLQEIASLEKALAKALEKRLLQLRQVLSRLELTLKDPRRGITEKRLRLDEMERRIFSAISYMMKACAERNKSLCHRLAANSPSRLVYVETQRLKSLDSRLESAVSSFLDRKRSKFAALAGNLEAVSPLACLARGYSLVYDGKGRLVWDAARVDAGDRLRIVPERGKIICEVLETENEFDLFKGSGLGRDECEG
jgi:exodeoxyribonuclease VII large subunit